MLTKNCICGQNFTSNADFTIVVPVKKAFLVSSQHLKNNIILIKKFYRAHTKFQSMTISIDLGPHKPKWINYDFWALE